MFGINTHAHRATHCQFTFIHYMVYAYTSQCAVFYLLFHLTSHTPLPCPSSPCPSTHSTLTEWNLPACIEETGDDAVPESILEKNKAVKEKGGLAKLDELMSEMPELVTRNKEILAEVSTHTHTHARTHARTHTHTHTLFSFP